MLTSPLSKILAGLVTVSLLPFAAAAAVDTVDQAALTKLTASWANRPKLALNQMVVKYGLPQEATTMTVIWHNAGPYKCITLNSVETPHNFPKPHMDFLQHTIAMKVPSGKADELVQFDGSNSFSRTEGEMSARCDSEAHNVLTLNLIHDILAGKKTAAEARKAFDQNIIDDMLGKNPPYMMDLQFDPTATAGPDPDKVTIPGAPEPISMTKETKGDAEILCVVAAIDENEILAAEEAEKRKVSPDVMDYAKMMHTEHGMNIDMTMKLGKKIDTAPMETAKTDALRVKGAGELAALVPLDGDAFGKAYMTAMVKGHTEALDTIENDLLKTVENDSLKKHLVETREHVSMHLDQAKKIQAAMK